MSEITARGVQPRQAGVESHEQVGRTERHGGIFKDMLRRVVAYRSISGEDDMRVAIAETIGVKNDMCRHGGSAHPNGCLASSQGGSGSSEKRRMPEM